MPKYSGLFILVNYYISFLWSKFLSLIHCTVTCNVQFINWATAYNRKNRNQEEISLSYEQLIPVWLLFEVSRRIDLRFPVVRDTSRHLNIELVCEYIYPKLRKCVDLKWIDHNCSRCSSRLVVMDGNMKVCIDCNSDYISIYFDYFLCIGLPNSLLSRRYKDYQKGGNERICCMSCISTSWKI